MYLSGGITTQRGSIPSDFKTRYFECTILLWYNPGQNKICKESEIFFSIYIIGYSVSIIILRHNRRVCVKSGIKQMSVSVGVSKSLDFQSMGERKYRCMIAEVK